MTSPAGGLRESWPRPPFNLSQAAEKRWVLKMRINAIVFSQPNLSSIRIRFFWLIAYPACRVVG